MPESGPVFSNKLDHPGGRTRISVGVGALAASAAELSVWMAGRTVFLLTTPTLRELYGPIAESLTSASGRCINLEVPDGEEAKTLEHASRLWNEMLSAGGKRDSRLITFGGGTVGDLGGFVAGCFLRGIEYSQVPTTLLAQVDAAIGGKTAVDLAAGKNTVGLFHHPVRVIADTEVLGSLPVPELRSGLVEVVKMAALLDPELLERVESGLDGLLAGDSVALAPVVAGAVAAKCAVVERDPAEGDWRRILNFGHTLGHAIEGVLDYRGLRHGEAVAYGMLFAMRLARSRGLEFEFGERLRRLLERFDLPALPSLEPIDLWSFMSRDKKATESGLVWVLPLAPGHGELVSGIGRDEVLSELEGFLSDPMQAA